jgi:hypothetical protein
MIKNNSKIFDINIFIRKIKILKIQVICVIGNLSQYKSLIISHKDFPFTLNFIDLKMFLPSRSANDNARLFMKKDSNLVKDNSLRELNRRVLS